MIGLIAVSLDLLASTIRAKSEEWNLRPLHFAERHGLIINCPWRIFNCGCNSSKWTGTFI
ncbi:MAG: hypothetical protein ACI9SI_000864 [Polaribacter sp.]|jgi:hypothetical protein